MSPSIAPTLAATAKRGGHISAEDEALATLVHELSAPVTAIEGFAELLAGPDGALDDETLRASATAIRRNASQLRELLNAFADARRIGMDALDLRPVATDVGALVDDTVASLSELLDPHPLQVSVRATAAVSLDPVRVRQALTHLVRNAAKFSRADAPVEVDVDVRGGWAELCVADHGEGIPEDQQPLLFGRFVQLRRGPGAGLGLYIARGIALAHGGDLVLATSSPSGSRFVLRLPVGSADDE